MYYILKLNNKTLNCELLYISIILFRLPKSLYITVITIITMVNIIIIDMFFFIFHISGTVITIITENIRTLLFLSQS